MAEPTPLPLTVASCESSSPATWTFDQELATDMQLKCVIQGNLPFHTFGTDSFAKLAQKLQPKYERVSQTTLLHLAFNHYVQAKKDLMKYFEDFQGKVSLTIHAWKTVDDYNLPHHCLTCHWIDSETWKISKRVISLEQYQDVHGTVMSSISEFNLKDKIMSITFDDSAKYHEKATKKLKKKLNPMFNGEFFQTKCACRILNSMVKSSLDYVAPVIKKIESLHFYVFYLKSTEFRKFLRAKGDKFSHIVPSTPDEWNTIYMMLDRMVKRKSLVVEFYASCGDNDIDVGDHDNDFCDNDIDVSDKDIDVGDNDIDVGDNDIDVGDNDWEIIESLLGILKVFHSSILRLSDAYYPTTPLVLGEILLIAHMFKEYKKNPFWEPVIMEMQSKLLKYYITLPPVFTCGAALNPTIGIGGVENILEDIEGFLGLDLKDGFARDSMRKCSEALHEVFGYYDGIYRSRGRERNITTESVSRNIIKESVSRKKSRSAIISNELELYTKTDFSSVMSCEEYENCNMLEWWRDKGRLQYPIMAEIVRDILTVQASSTTLEFAFCLNGRVMDDLTAWNLRPRFEKMRMFLKEHYDDNEGEKNVELVEDDDENEDFDLFLDDGSDEELNMLN